jgi:hypothetical protein
MRPMPGPELPSLCKIIRPSQTAFLPGRYILEEVVILHETIHELQRKKQKCRILKLDFEMV